VPRSCIIVGTPVSARSYRASVFLLDWLSYFSVKRIIIHSNKRLESKFLADNMTSKDEHEHLLTMLRKVLPSHWAALICVSVALSQTPAYTAKPRTRGYCIAWCVCLLPSRSWYSFTGPGRMKGWVALVSFIRRLFTPSKMVTHLSTNRALRCR